MGDEIYYKLANVLDTLPNGFPATGSKIEIRLLKKIFRPEDIELFCDLKLHFETARRISERTGRPLESPETHLDEMRRRGQLFGVDIGGVKVFKMVPWVFGIYEFQLPHMDRELADMCEAYMKDYGEQFFKNKPQLMQVIPIEREIKATHEALTYEKVSSIIETGQSFLVQDCICKKEQGLLDHPCDRPNEICMAIAPIEVVFDDTSYVRKATKDEAYDLIRQCEENALVHLAWNVESGHFFICNCCGVLRSINELDIRDAVNSYYYAEINTEACTACGTYKDERCQVDAV